MELFCDYDFDTEEQQSGIWRSLMCLRDGVDSMVLFEYANGRAYVFECRWCQRGMYHAVRITEIKNSKKTRAFAAFYEVECAPSEKIEWEVTTFCSLEE